jgi:amidase
LAYAKTLPGVEVARALQDQVARVASGAARAGATVKHHLPDVDWDAMNRLFGELVQCITGLFAPGSQLSEEQRSLAWYLTALAQRDRFAAAWEPFFAEFDALILPPSTTAAFTHRQPGVPLEIDRGNAPYEDQGLMLVFCNLLGLPSLAVPAGFDDDGLPIGVQIVGPRWSETRLIEIARALEESEVLPGFVAPRPAVEAR